MISEPCGANDVRASRNIRLSPEEFHTAVPKFHTAVPKFHTAVPKFHTAVSKFHKAVPKFYTAVPKFHKAACTKWQTAALSGWSSSWAWIPRNSSSTLWISLSSGLVPLEELCSSCRHEHFHAQLCLKLRRRQKVVQSVTHLSFVMQWVGAADKSPQVLSFHRWKGF